eukprot:TRINITY_DN19146_c0_g1_i1.p1 TRINITY_DN19146_c0_g1~~TRINITY_DN19146_c0_g1_i1.p1  ORF type:complete len:171 (-),score=23.01 TRINITY_DN19146_c0_g1_i1:87-599(-)
MVGPWRSAMAEVWERTCLFVNFGCLYSVFTNYVMEVTMCMGPSMLPTFNAAGDVVLMEHLSPRFDWLRTGDVVVARSPTNPRLNVCKRIKTFEGDFVEVLPQHQWEKTRRILVPKGHVWLQGDNVKNSTDSRHYGPVPAALIQGRVFYRIWPIGQVGPIRSSKPATAEGE